MSNLKPVTVSRQSSREERQTALYQIYKQVLERQPYIYERKILAKAEQDFLNDKIGVRRFLKELGHSEIYLNSFYHNSSNMKFLELCFKHFLGRAPLNQAEIKFYCDILMYRGVAQMITTMLDSEEYRKAFGCFTVPYPRKQEFHESPQAYMESELLNHELLGRRGRSIPTIYWHQLGLNCDAGVCRHPEANEQVELSLSQEELAHLLKLLQSPQSSKTAANLSPQQKELLRRAIG
ncbi:phycobilisome rod-core linker polypeptide [Kovacikia minuta CCNUW1]|uniref:phycobilisome rod-core linker polypeptide n=1 Tax=Kovacikia minuta TaxID=2931930 RepID=UPI001CCCBB11|nr:phycobilisome rod-core linker polypeptide [Kovacikia minuta]UBF24192.1 phycobilisome rod-core linker polypeptide [Kovacikia minuta CCNUW1]